MRYTLLGFLCVITVIAYLQRSTLGVPSKAIEADLQLTPQAMGLVWLGWYIGYAAFQLPSGWIADRLGSKPALLIFTVTWSLLTAAVGLATDFASLVTIWSLMGAAQAGIFPCAAKVIGVTFRPTEQAFASGLLTCCMAAGAALSQEVTGRLLGPLTWQQILTLYALPGLIWAVVFGLVITPPDAPRPRASEWVAAQPPIRWSRLLTDRQMVLLCAQQFQRAAATALFFTWFPRYLQETKGVTPLESGSMAAVPLIAGMLGGIIGGAASDAMLRWSGNPRLSRQGLATVSMSVCAVVSVAAYFTADAYTAVFLVSIAAFCGYIGGVSAYAVAISMGGTRVAPVFATMNMAGNIGAGIFPFALGHLVGLTGNWNVTLLLFAGLFAGAAICWAMLNPKGPLFAEEQ